MMKFLLPTLFIGICVYIIYLCIDGKKKYKEFVDFLKRENDFETLEKIGARYHGEDLNYQMRVLIGPMEERLLYMYEKTGKKEYMNYLDSSHSRTYSFIVSFIAFFAIGICIYLIYFS